jgi:oxygen-independent coproporphyrinogen III oxidase
MMATQSVLEKQLARVLAGTPLRRARFGLGGSHTVVTYPPLDALSVLDGDPVAIEAPDAPLHLYFHIAFCEFICPFCHYAKTYRGGGQANEQLRAYMEALLREMSMRCEGLRRGAVESIYIGGGTPTSLSIPELEPLIERINELGPVPRFCVETSPLTVVSSDGLEKLRWLIAAGVNRVSIGIQSFDDYALSAYRGHDQRLAREALERLLGLGIDINIDLMQDLPFQSRGSIDEDLALVDQYRPRQVTWYILRFHEESSMSRAFRRGELPAIPGNLESALRREQIIRGMESLGYVSLPGCRFARAGAEDGYKRVRGGVDSHLLGLGVAAYSHGWGWFFRNVTSQRIRGGIRTYIERIRAGRSPVASGAALLPAELFAGRLSEAVRRTVPERLVEQDDETGGEARVLLEKLSDAGLVLYEGDGWRLSAIGLLFEEEIASLFYSRAMRTILRQRDAYWAPDSWFTAPPRRHIWSRVSGYQHVHP